MFLGMAFTNWIGRNIRHEILNFGFSGNCLMELNVSQYLQQIVNPALFIVDCVWNMQPSLIANNTVPLIKVFLLFFSPLLLPSLTPLPSLSGSRPSAPLTPPSPSS